MHLYSADENLSVCYMNCRCTTKSEDDYRPLFENFVMDLLEMAHHPEWPAVEPVLVILVNLLVGILKAL